MKWIITRISILIVVMGIVIGILFTSDYRHNVYKFLVEKQFSRMKRFDSNIGSFCIKYENNEIKKFGDSSSDLNCSSTIKLYDDKIFYEKLFLYKDIGLGEAFVDGIWNVSDHNHDLADVLVHLSFKLYNRDYSIMESIITFLNPGFWQLYFERMGIKKSIKEDKYTISYHYDIGNDFYYNFLGKSMMYTCAFWSNSNNNLDAAQKNKIDIIIQKMNIKSTDNVLDIGSGWGFMASYIANHTNAKVTGIALAKEQIKWSQNHFNKDNKNNNGAKYYYADYREYCRDIKNKKKFNKIYSIGMLEHVHSKRIDEFMQCMHELFMDEPPNIESDADNPMIMGLHYISRTNIYPDTVSVPDNPDKRCKRITWVGKYVLPGGCLLHSDWVHQAAMKAGFTMLHQESYGLHYAKTTREWRHNIMKNWDLMVVNHPNYDIRLYKTYIYLFAIAEVGFRMGHMDLIQQIYIKPSQSISGFVDGKLDDVKHHIINVNQRDPVTKEK